jgi:hypothetical protein
MSRMTLLFALIGLLFWGGCVVASAQSTLPFVPFDAPTSRVQSAAEQIVASFAAKVIELLDGAVPPSVEVRNTPNLAYFDHRSWTIVIGHWPTLDPPSRAFFLELTETAEDAAALFVGLFDEFLIAHEMAHWLHRTLGVERDRYASEQEANDLAVAFFLTGNDGEARLLALRPRLEAALARLFDPTPPGADEADYFNDQYAALVRNPYLYGFYQFRFILDSIARRGELDFVSLLLDAVAE